MLTEVELPAGQTGLAVELLLEARFDTLAFGGTIVGGAAPVAFSGEAKIDPRREWSLEYCADSTHPMPLISGPGSCWLF